MSVNHNFNHLKMNTAEQRKKLLQAKRQGMIAGVLVALIFIPVGLLLQKKFELIN